MEQDLSLKTRREFLRSTVLTGALSWTVPTFLANTFSALQAEAIDKATQVTTGKDGQILVVLQMAGGNDGLNTVVPFANDYYRKARPRIGLTEKQTLKINDEIGFHANLSDFKELYDAGELSVIQGVGYPNPNRSHFRSTEIWQTASDSERIESSGWLGRYFDNSCSGCDPTVAINIGRQMPQAFASHVPKGISLESPGNYRFISGDKGKKTGPGSTEESYRRLNELEGEMMENSGSTVASISGAAKHQGSALD